MVSAEILSPLESVYLDGIVKIPIEEFRSQMAQDTAQILHQLNSGKVIIVKNAYPEQELVDLRGKVHALGLNTEKNFHKIKEKGPNFHHLVTRDNGYKVPSLTHKYFFFNWNKDPWGLFSYFDEMLSNLQILSGYGKNGVVNNTPKDGLVMRMHIHQYPTGGGYMEKHKDPAVLQKSTMLICLTEYGKDYHSGGVYFAKKEGEKVHLDERLKVGDVVLAHPSIEHGVSPIDSEEEFEWTSEKGRWMVLFGFMPTD